MSVFRNLSITTEDFEDLKKVVPHAKFSSNVAMVRYTIVQAGLTMELRKIINDKDMDPLDALNMIHALLKED